MAEARTLYDKAVANLFAARMLRVSQICDEEQLNIAGFHLQQAVELALKYLLEAEGIEYPKTHSIEQLIALGRKHGANLPLTDYIDDHAEMFSQWEAKSRYILGYAIEDRKIDRALEEVDTFLLAIARDAREQGEQTCE